MSQERIKIDRAIMKNQGVYSSNTTYEKLDIVNYQGARYIAKQSTIGNDPTLSNNYWQLLAAVGTYNPTIIDGILK